MTKDKFPDSDRKAETMASIDPFVSEIITAVKSQFGPNLLSAMDPVAKEKMLISLERVNDLVKQMETFTYKPDTATYLPGLSQPSIILSNETAKNQIAAEFKKMADVLEGDMDNIRLNNPSMVNTATEVAKGLRGKSKKLGDLSTVKPINWKSDDKSSSAVTVENVIGTMSNEDQKNIQSLQQQYTQSNDHIKRADALSKIALVTQKYDSNTAVFIANCTSDLLNGKILSLDEIFNSKFSSVTPKSNVTYQPDVVVNSSKAEKQQLVP
jgi:hypothetical protein